MNRSAFRFPKPVNPLRFDGERFVSGLLGNASSGDIQSEHYHRYLFALQVCGGKDVLDIASGEGYGSHCLGQVARSVIGVDANAEAVDFANQNYLTECVSFKLGKAQSIPIIDQSIDVVVSFETLEHFKEHEAFASEVRRVLRPDGLLVISSPNRTVYSDEANYKNEWHLRELDRGEFVGYLSASFANVRMFAQRPMAGSIIAVDDAAGSGGQPEGFILRGEGLFHRTEGIPHPPFFVALASDAKIPEVRSSVLQNPALLRHIDQQRQTASEDAARAVARAADLENSLTKAMRESSEQAVALASSRNENAILIARLDQVRSGAEQARSVIGIAAQQELAELRRQLNLAALSADRVQTVRQELTAARRRNLELVDEADALRRERGELTSEADNLRRERDELTSDAGSLRRERDELASETDSQRRERDELISEADNLREKQNEFISEMTDLRRERDEIVIETDSLRQERDQHLLSLDSIRGSTTWRATSPLRRLGSILPPSLRRPLRSGAAAGLPLATPQWTRTERARETPDPGPLACPPSQSAGDQAVKTHPSELCVEGNKVISETDSVRRLLCSSATADSPLASSQCARTGGAAETPDPVPPSLSASQSAEDQAAEARPSDLQRRRDASWVEPNERPEFIHLGDFGPRARIAVVVHIYYPEVWQELAQAISNIPTDFDLFVTLVTGASDALAPMIRESFPDAHVLLVDNHGRDIFPFLALIRTEVLFNYDLICKVHSKRSTYREGGDEWRKYLIGGILGSTDVVDQILRAFRSDPDLGIVVAPGQIFGGRDYWTSNEARSSKLFREIGLNESAFERDFAGGSIYWIRPFILRPVNALRLSYDDFEAEPITNDGYTAHAVERLVSVICHDAGMRLADSENLLPSLPAQTSTKVHVIANYLPQYHPTPENDAWWGKGFTEWTNVTKALPLFRGHRQPRLSTELGFYDLRMPQTRIAQADLARRHGVTAFSYYYYWFNGRKLLNGPIEDVVASGEPNFPFMLCWANEPWTRNWDGLSEDILMPQDYTPGWERAFAADVAAIMRDPRYLRLNGKPMLALYRVAHFPDKTGSIARLRAAFEEEGFPAIHLVGAWVRIGDDEALPMEASDLGLDAYFEFPPHGIPSQPLEIPVADRVPGFAAHTYDYGATVDAVIDQVATSQTGFRYRGVMMGWDNTARRGAKSFAFHGATPANFRRWLRAAMRSARAEAREAETAVFINAWNEWAEGTYLEPDRDFGMGWLEAVASATAEAYRTPSVVEIMDDVEIEVSDPT